MWIGRNQRTFAGIISQFRVMKPARNLLLTIGACLLSLGQLNAQNTPIWTKDINAFPDSAMVIPVRTLVDDADNVLVLSTYYKSDDLGNVVTKINLNKYNEAGDLIWNLIFDNGGIDEPRAFDMALDWAGNSYIAGGFMETSSYQPLLLKVDSSGTIVWLKNSTGSFVYGFFGQIIAKHNRLYLGGQGIAVFNQDGEELWSNNLSPNYIAVDNMGQLIATGYDGDGNSVFRYDSLGSQNLADSAVYYATRIATDKDNNFYLLTSSNQYELVKYNSNGTFAWNRTGFPETPPFGDIGLEVLTDNENDVLVVGLADSIFKFSPAGNLIWQKSMNGLDDYRLKAQIYYNGLLVAGTYYNGTEYEVKAALFNSLGQQNWVAGYNTNPGLQEFMEDMALDNSGVFILANDNQRGKLIKFEAPFSAQEVDYSLVCVDSVWYDPNNPNRITTRLFNGNAAHLNYPSVQIISPSGDTIGNPKNNVDYFAQLSNTYQDYYDSISVTGITDFSNYTFLVSEGFGDTTAVITWCSQTGITEISQLLQVSIYPNPFTEWIIITTNGFQSKAAIFKLYDVAGRALISKKLDSTNHIPREHLSSGLYFYTIENEGKIMQSGKLVAQ